MIIPPNLKQGDKIGIIAPARKISFYELENAIEIIQSWKLEVIFGKFLFESENQFSASIEKRVIDLQEMINDNSIKGIFCARGGYGTVQIVDHIDFYNLKCNPKWIVGFSDITVLHSQLNNIGLASLHASMPINFPKNTSESLDSVYKCLFGLENIVKFQSNKFNRIGETDSEIIGGNLSILYSLLGSKSDLNTDGKILFIEDLDEYLYHLDRMMTNLKRNGKFDKLNGMIIGAMSDMKDNTIPFGKKIEEIVLAHTKDFTFPICFGFPSGHLDDNRSLQLGVKSNLKIDTDEVLLKQL
jgi:muramoyltetrapeptide carboxypeptidase